MYTSTQHRHQPMYGGGIPSSSYHWDHQLRVPNHDRITVSSHPTSDPPHWYSDSVLCQAAPTISIQQMKSDHVTSSNSNNGLSPINSKSLNSQEHHTLLYPPAPQHQQQGAGPRAVIPSKRAAQNRAAQRAFRQRKERYVKDLEKKAKLMDEWKLELDQLRQQNKELIENTMRLEKQIHQQQQLPSSKNYNNKPISPITSPTLSTEVVPPPVVVVMDNNNLIKTTSRRKIKQEVVSPPPQPHKIQTTFLPVNLRAPDQTGYGSPTTSCSSSSSSIAGLEDSQAQQYHMSWPTSSAADFDPYETNNLDFMSHGGQVLDDLCAVLQTRQRPEINSSYATMQHQDNYTMSSTSPTMVRQHDNQDILMSRSY